MEGIPSSRDNPPVPGFARLPSKRLRIWLIAISILAVILFLVDAVLAYAIISASVDHLRSGTKSISAGNSIIVTYSVDDFQNDLEVEIPAILVTLIILASGPVGGWVLLKRKPGLAFGFSLLGLVSLITTFILLLMLVFS